MWSCEVFETAVDIESYVCEIIRFVGCCAEKPSFSSAQSSVNESNLVLVNHLVSCGFELL